MKSKHSLVGIEQYLDVFRKGIAKLKKGNGSVILFSGESGMGKSALLEHFDEYTKKNERTITSILTESNTPIGDFKIGKLQPLYSFSKAVEYLLESKELSPERRLARNVGLTALAVIPLIGDVFYAVKEMGKDWRQFKKEKSSESVRKVSNVAADYYDTFLAFADKKPLIILMDDMHWSDAQSVELLSLMSEKITDFPIMIVASYKESDLQSQALPFYNFVNKAEENPAITKFALEPFILDYIRDLSKDYFVNYRGNNEFEKWIFDHSYGVPGVIVEYLKYFSQFPPFDNEGRLVMNFEGNEFLPSTVQSVFAQHLESLSDEDRNLLAICSAEGREFTANIVSQLFNLDVLSTIKKLRSLQNNTGIIKSIGAQVRYGVKTTVYKFTQAFYHSFFENSLEYEEYTALHGQIAALLKQKFEATEDENLRGEIAPYLAAHSSESGDEVTTRDMLMIAAKSAANKYGSADVIKDAVAEYSELADASDSENFEYEFGELLRQTETPSDISIKGANGEGSSSFQSFDTAEFKFIRKSIVNDLLNNDFDSATLKSKQVLTTLYDDLTHLEKIQILTLAAKSNLSKGDFDAADENLQRASSLLSSYTDPIAESIVYANIALYNFHRNNLSKAYYYLDKAASITTNLPSEVKLLLLSAIAIITNNSSAQKASGYYEAANKLSKSLKFENFSKELKELV